MRFGPFVCLLFVLLDFWFKIDLNEWNWKWTLARLEIVATRWNVCLNANWIFQNEAKNSQSPIRFYWFTEWIYAIQDRNAQIKFIKWDIYSCNADTHESARTVVRQQMKLLFRYLIFTWFFGSVIIDTIIRFDMYANIYIACCLYNSEENETRVRIFV